MKIIFFGSPKYTIPIINQIKSLKHQLLCVVTQNDKKGKGKRILKTAVSLHAEKNHIRVLSPLNLTNRDFTNEIKDLDPDLIIIFAYGKILPTELITMPKYGCLNIHASILPKWRGAAPIQRMLLNGEKETGITFFKLNKDLDKGDIILIHKTNISNDDDNLTLQTKLSKIAVQNLEKAIEYLIDGSKLLKQNDSESSYAKKILKEECRINWDDTAKNIVCKIKAFVGWPVAEGPILGVQVRIWSAKLLSNESSETPGEIVGFDKNGLKISTGKGIVDIQKLQFAGRNIITSEDLFNSNSSFSEELRKSTYHKTHK